MPGLWAFSRSCVLAMFWYLFVLVCVASPLFRASVADSGTEAVLDAGLIKSRVPNVICPDKRSYCSGEQTCCPLKGGRWGCCPFPYAVCCSDGAHCCPSGTKCDVEGRRCVFSSAAGVHSTQSELVKVQKNDEQASVNDVELCPDGEALCFNDETCCEMKNQTWGCCPYSEATCCPDKMHCCPNGYGCVDGGARCAQKYGTTMRPKSVPLSSNLAALPRVPRDMVTTNDAVICPGEQVQCPDGNTCCELASGSYGCCPMPEATCCLDKMHCCPYGYHCDGDSGKCLRKYGSNLTPESVPWSSKLPAVPGVVIRRAREM